MKKFLKWLLIVLVSTLFIIVAIIACVDPSADVGTTNKAMADMTPQQIDLELYRPVRSAIASYNDISNMMQQLDTGEASLLDLYDTCKQVKDWELKWTDTIESMTNDDTAEYAEAAKDYVMSVSYGLATPIMDYIDNKEIESLSEAKETLKLLPAYYLNVESARSAFLSKSGLTEEEIQQQLALG